MMLKTKIKTELDKIVEKRYHLSGFDFSVEYPRIKHYGDCSSNVGMVLAKKLKRKPVEVAEEIAQDIEQSDIYGENKMVADVFVAGPGFVNLKLSSKLLTDNVEAIIKGNYFKIADKWLKGKKFLIEHTSANPVHTIHVAHLRNNFIGMCIYRLLQSLGASVSLDYIENDRGTGVARAMLGYLAFADKSLVDKYEGYIDNLKSLKLDDQLVAEVVTNFDWEVAIRKWFQNKNLWLLPQDLGVKSDYFDLCIYSPGSRAAHDFDQIKDQVQQLLIGWEKENRAIRRLWKLVVNWSFQGYKQTLARIGSQTDKVWYESEIYKRGKKWVEKGLKMGVFKKLEDGAVISQLEKFGLSDTILLKSNGASLYHTQDFGLTELKVDYYKNYDKYIWCVGNDQLLYLKQLFIMVDQLGITDKEKLFHLNFGFIRLKSGQMKSRLGRVVNADDLMNIMKDKAGDIMNSSSTGWDGASKANLEEKNNIAEKVMLAALKYGLLRYGRDKDFVFDVNQSLLLTGDSGPYVQYSYTRCVSVLANYDKKERSRTTERNEGDTSESERDLLACLLKAEEILVEAGEQLAPSLICDYSYNLSKLFNLFYEKNRIIGSGEYEKFRIKLTRAVKYLLGFNLNLLGIDVLDRM